MSHFPASRRSCSSWAQSVGAEVGTCDGALVNVGDPVGSRVGGSDGDTVGAPVCGNPVGTTVGS